MTDYERLIKTRDVYSTAIKFIRKTVELNNVQSIIHTENCKTIDIKLSTDAFKRLYNYIRIDKSKSKNLVVENGVSSLEIDMYKISFRYKLSSTTYTFFCTHPLKHYTITDAINVHKEEKKLLNMI